MTLLLHTSTSTAHMGLAREESLLAQHALLAGRRFSETCAKEVHRLLQAQQAELSALKKIVVHAGPGGFTPLRVGITTANVLGYALGIPVVGVSGSISTLEELLEHSHTLPSTGGNVVKPLYRKEPDIGPLPSQRTP